MSDYAPLRALWSAVIVQAIKDVDLTINKHRGGDINLFRMRKAQQLLIRRYASDWLFSPSRRRFSLCWICETLGLNERKIATACLTREGRKALLRRKEPRG